MDKNIDSNLRSKSAIKNKEDLNIQHRDNSFLFTPNRISNRKMSTFTNIGLSIINSENIKFNNVKEIFSPMDFKIKKERD